MTVPQLEQSLAAGIQCHDAGDLPQAERHYREVLAADPRHAKATYLLGLLAHQVGKPDLAIGLISQAVRLDGRQPTFHARLGEAYRAAGRPAEAIECYRQALRLNGQQPDFHNGLGTLLQAEGDLAGAITCYRTAMALAPAVAGPHYNLGVALQQRGDYEAAAVAFAEVVRLEPENFQANVALAGMWQALGKTQESLERFRQLAEQHPDSPQLQCALGAGYQAAGNDTAALECYLRATDLAPDFAEAHYNLGTVLQNLGREDEAIGAYRHATRLNPGLAVAWSNLSNVCLSVFLPDEAATAAERAAALQPRSSSVLGNLAAAVQMQGDMPAAIAAYRRAIELNPQDYNNHSNLLYTLNFSPDVDTPALYAEHLAWASRHAEPLTAAAVPHANDRSPERRLRLGYVSAHFRTHAVAFFAEPLIRGHDRQQVELFLYSDVRHEDATTERFRGLADHWRDTTLLSDEQMARLVRDDQIDVLVDLAGHIGGNRLLAFARKPAPVQVTYLGYQNTTGMTAMDYRLTDAHADPPGETDRWYTERLVRLPGAFFVFAPPEPSPPVGPLPADRNGVVTFASLNNIQKLNPENFRVWARILERVPSARLVVLGYADGVLERNVRARISAAGIDASRVVLAGKRPRREYLELHNEIDIALDTFPFNGHTTVCDALWMGVPSIMLEGDSYASRFGGSTLLGVGLGDLIARSTDEYVELAVSLAGDRKRLGELRRTLREQFADSPLVDAPGFAAQVEAAYRNMWRMWCAPGSASIARGSNG